MAETQRLEAVLQCPNCETEVDPLLVDKNPHNQYITVQCPICDFQWNHYTSGVDKSAAP